MLALLSGGTVAGAQDQVRAALQALGLSIVCSLLPQPSALRFIQVPGEPYVLGPGNVLHQVCLPLASHRVYS